MSNGTNHPWEVAGLGKYPFRVVGVFENRGPIHMPDGTMVGAPGQPMGTCDYCGNGIAECWSIKAADGKRFIVGCDCVRKAYAEAGERVPAAVEAYAREKRKRAADAKDKAVRDRLDEILASPPPALRDAKVVTPWGEERAAVDDLKQVLRFCGAAGRARHLKRIERMIAGN